MKNVNTKALMLLTIFMVSAFAIPTMATAYDTDDLRTSQFGGIKTENLIGNFSSGFGGLFSQNLGYAGNLLGLLFEILFTQGLNLTNYEMLDSVYVLNASIERTVPAQSYSFNGSEVRYLPYDYYGPSHDFNTDGYAYCEIERSGSYSVEYETGAAITLIIWDNDKSFITALNRLVTTLRQFMAAQINGDIPEALITKAVETITWFLIHINDIFTGDELFVLNPITWNKMNMTLSTNFEFNKDWKYTGPDYERGTGDDIPINASTLNAWRTRAANRKDEYANWLLTNVTYTAGTSKVWTQFSFDLFQLWIKNFHIQINVGDLLSGSEPNIADIFGGCDIEFFLFTHHLSGAFLYNDTIKPDNRVSVNYTQLKKNDGTPITNTDGSNVTVPTSSELTHRLHLQSVADYKFDSPQIIGQKVKWGLNLNDVLLTPVPIGVDTESYLNNSDESLDNIFFGFEFIPRVDGSLAQGKVKLDQTFSEWNSGEGAETDITNLDLSIIYISTVLHFQLKIENQAVDRELPPSLLGENDYKEEEKSLRIGNYLGTDGRELEFVDIAGLNYTYGTSNTQAEAYSAIIPVALWEMEANAHETFEYGEENTQAFESDIGLNVSFNVLAYAVCYPEFEDGNKIVHDPTFNVFMIFEPTIFWAVILLVGGITLVGVATILIKRKKDGKKPF
ncbi:MAG: hypothetical protein GF317_00370 [Candidatus Lokiarchaeota archaeon]|nr:hypothetical protein [Candidatus Lokiarchaeota archaeon]MBD3198430.1 hypothetical protein [Candidatus Lokiarchaeota archaeon]